MSTPAATQPQRPLTLMQAGVIEHNVRMQIAEHISLLNTSGTLNAGCYVPPDLSVAVGELIHQTLTAVMIEVGTGS